MEKPLENFQEIQNFQKQYYVDIQNNYKFNCVGLGKGTIFDGYDKNKYDFSKFKNANIDFTDYVAQPSCDKGFMAIFDRKGEVIYDKNIQNGKIIHH